MLKIGTVSIRGCNVHGDKETSSMQVAGPITKHAEDIPLILKVLSEKHNEKLDLLQPVSLTIIRNSKCSIFTNLKLKIYL